MPRMSCFRKWYGQYVQTLEQGHTVVTSLLDSAAFFRGRLTQLDAAILQELGNESRVKEPQILGSHTRAFCAGLL